MNAESTSKWLGISANFGVVIGLALLIVELDQNGDLVRAQIHQARSDNHVSGLQERANSEFLGPALQKFTAAGGFSDPPSAIDQLSPVEAYRVKEFLRSRLSDYANLFYQREQGYLDEDFYQSTVVPAIRRFGGAWDGLGLAIDTRSASFHAEVERILGTE